MGMQDQDGDKFSPYGAKKPLSPFWMLMFWLAVLYGLYSLAHLYLKPKPIVISATGDVLIPRSKDGHFYATGRVAGQPLTSWWIPAPP